MLIAQNLRKQYGERVVLDNVTIKVSKGEIVGLLGPNGAGKTTAFSIIAGLISGEGRISLNEKDITEFSMFKRAREGMSFLPQEHSVFRDLTVEENIVAILEHHFSSFSKIKERVEELIERFSLSGVRNQKASTLSGGEKRRLEIARAISFFPEFILLDEPFTGIDPIAVNDIQNLLLELKKEGFGILISDHNVLETLKVTDRAYILFSGKVLEEGNPEFLVESSTVKEKYLGENVKVIQ